MISFKLSEEQEQLQRLARDFAQKEIAPIAAECDREDKHPQQVIDKLHALGLLNITLPEEYGGGGMGMLEACIIGEEFSAACPGIGTTIMANTLAMTPIKLFATPEQMKEIVVPFCAKPNLAAFALTEPGAGSDPGAMTTRAELQGDHYILNGTKCFITNGGICSIYTVFAVTNKALGVKGISAFIVPADSPGLTIGKFEDKMGHRASKTAQVCFEDVKVPKRYLLGKEGEGFKIAMMTLDQSRACVAAGAVGLARAAMEHSIKYAKERVQFGKPIAEQQAIAFKIADMGIKVETARLITWYAAWLADNKIRNSYQSAIAKAYATDIAMQVAEEAVQIFGGYGYMKDYPVEKLMRDAKLMKIYEGTNEIQRVVISRHLLS